MEPTLHCAKPGAWCEGRFTRPRDREPARLPLRRPEARADRRLPRARRSRAACGEGGTFVKRLIGLPGETVSEHAGVISIDGKPLARVVRARALAGHDRGHLARAEGPLLLRGRRPLAQLRLAHVGVRAARAASIGPLFAHLLAARRGSHCTDRAEPGARQPPARRGDGFAHSRCRALVEAGAVPDEHALRLDARQRARRRRAAAAGGRRSARRPRGRTGASRARPRRRACAEPGSQSATSRHQRLSPHRQGLEGRVAERLPGARRARRRAGVAQSAQSRSCRSSSWSTPAGGPSARIRSSSPGAVDRVDQPDAAVDEQRVRGARRRAFLDPAEPSSALVNRPPPHVVA